MGEAVSFCERGAVLVKGLLVDEGEMCSFFANVLGCFQRSVFNFRKHMYHLMFTMFSGSYGKPGLLRSSLIIELIGNHSKSHKDHRLSRYLIFPYLPAHKPLFQM